MLTRLRALLKRHGWRLQARVMSGDHLVSVYTTLVHSELGSFGSARLPEQQAAWAALKDTLHAHRELVSAAVAELEKKHNAKVLGDLRILEVK